MSTVRRVVVVLVAALLAATALAVPARADQAPIVMVGDVTVTESDAGLASAVFTLTLTRAVSSRISVSYGTSDSTARAPGDYTATSGLLVFPAGITSRTVVVDVVGDTLYEGDETFFLNIGSSNAGVSDPQGVATIVDDDPRPYVSTGNATVTEGDSGAVTASFPVTLDRPSAQPVRVRYATSDGTAAAGDAGGAPADYSYTRGTLTIPAGQTAAQVDVPVTGDTYDEGVSEYFYLNLTNVVGAVAFGSAGVGTIVDDDGTPLISVLDTAVVEGASGTTTTMVFTVKLSATSPRPVTLFYGTNEGTATAADFTPRSGSLVFAPGETSKTIGVTVKGDALDEGNNEYMSLVVGDAIGATVADNQGYGEIVDDDPTRSAASFLTVDTATVVEPDSGTTNLVFTVRLQPAASTTVSVNYGTSDGSAVAGSDYTTTAGTLSFAAGTTSKTVSVPVKGDTVQEGDEYVNFGLSSPVNASIDDSSAYGYILNQDIAPIVTVADTTVAEGDSGTGDVAVEITLSQPATVTSSVVYTTYDYGASAPTDYTQVNGTAVFQPGQDSVTVHVPVVGDTLDETDETFRLYLSSPFNVNVPDTYGAVIITDDDRNPAISIDDPSVFEGTGGTAQAVFTVSLAAASPNVVTVNYGTGNGSAVEADYTPVNGTLTFAPGETSKTVPVAVTTDSVDENSEYFYVYLWAPANAYLQESNGNATILDDDTAPLISIGEGAVQEPQSGTATMTFPVKLSAASLNTVTVNYSTGDGNATAPGDYVAKSGTLTFAPGTTSQTISVAVVGDTITENNEYLNLYLGSPVGANLRDSSTYGTIWDTDWQSYLSVTDVGVVEGNSGTRNATFTVNLNPPSVNTVTVTYGTQDGTATVGGADYTTTSGTLTFTPGQTSKTVAVPVTGDVVDEGDEYFGLALNAPVNATSADGFAYATIFDDDPSGGSSIISIDDDVVVEGTTATTTDLVFPVTVTPAPTSTVTVNYRTADSGATAEKDYQPTSGVLTFAAGQTSATVTVVVNGDTYDENDEAVRVELFGLRGPANIGDYSTLGTIIDDDRSPLVSIGDVSVNEGSSGFRSAVFTVRLSQASPQPVQVDWDTRDNNAIAPGDYQDASGTLSFAPGATSKTVTVLVRGDDLVEGDENFYVDLTSYVGGYRASAESTGIGTIVDNDAFPVIGSVVGSTGTAFSGATLTLTGNQQPTRTTTSATDGSYSFADVPDGQYTLTPTYSGKVFAPATASVSVQGGAVTGLTFIVLTPASISGQVVDANGVPVPGVAVTRTGNGQPDTTRVTNGQGWYGFTSTPAGTYTVTPKLTGSTFSPASRAVTLAASANATASFSKS